MAAIGYVVGSGNVWCCCTWYRRVGVVSIRGWRYSGRQGRQNVTAENEYFKLKIFVLLSQSIELLIQKQDIQSVTSVCQKPLISVI
jgi:hypothetical protein